MDVCSLAPGTIVRRRTLRLRSDSAARNYPLMLLADLTWPDVAALNKETPVIFPVAALEQHGRHMPVFTDSLLMGEIARRAEQQLGNRALFAPLQWLGNSHHHMDFPGTMSAEPRV